MRRFDVEIETNMEGLPSSIRPAPTTISGKIKCDRGCGVSFRPLPQTVYIGELVTSSGGTIPFFSTKCRDCRHPILWVEKDFPLVSRELMRHDQQTHGGN